MSKDKSICRVLNMMKKRQFQKNYINFWSYQQLIADFCFVLFLERDHVKGGQRGRGRERIQAGPMLSAVCPTWGLIPQTRSHDPRPKSRVACLTSWATQVPLVAVFMLLSNYSLNYNLMDFVSRSLSSVLMQGWNRVEVGMLICQWNIL